MLCPICNKTFSYLKVSLKLGQPEGVFFCPNCKSALKLVFEPGLSFGRKDVMSLLYLLGGLVIYYISHKYANYPWVMIILGPLILAGVMYLLVTYFEKFAKAVKADNNQDDL